MKILLRQLIFLALMLISTFLNSAGKAENPVIFADVPDMSIVRVGDSYYMSSTAMHMSPGVPIMKSYDLVNWKLVSYCYDTLDDTDELNLDNGKNAYGGGSWASCIRYVNNTFYVSTFAGTTGTTYIYSTKDIEKGLWEVKKFKPSYHDHTILFDDDGKIYMIWGAGQLRMVELKEDLSGVKEGTERVIIENASAPAGNNIMLQSEGSQLFKVNGKYYLFNITWPRNGMRTVIIHKADKITGPYEGRVALQDMGVAQGGLIDTPKGDWFAYLFRDYGAVGRIPYIVPVKWEDGWPILGHEGKVPLSFDLPVSNGLIPGIVASDDFKRKKNEAKLPLVWQWNHNPDNTNWEVTGRKGYLRLSISRIDKDVLEARNMLTQRTIGPKCVGETKINVSKMKEGDVAGLMLLQVKYAYAGVRFENGEKYIVMVNAGADKPEVVERILLKGKYVFFKATCDFTNMRDMADFFYSFDGKKWNKIGTPLHMKYTLPHFMGYRYGLFSYATKNTGGYVDFDYFNINYNN